MERPRKNSHFSSSNTSRERLNPISSSAFYSTTTNPHKPSQDRSLIHFGTPIASSVIMTDLGNVSDARHPSHETSASPPPAKRTRLNLKGKTPPQSISASPPANRINTRRSVAVASSASTSVAGDVQSSTPLIIHDGDLAQSTQNSRASSVMSASGPNTRSRKRKADQISSDTSSMNGESANQAPTNQDVIAHTPAIAAQKTRVAADSSSALNSDDKVEEQDLDQDRERNGDDQEKEEQVTVSRRGRPPGKGRGGGRGGKGGNRGGRGKGKAKAGKVSKAKAGDGSLTDQDFTKFFGPVRGKKTSTNHKVQVAYDRQADLKYNYKEVARMVRNGLEVLAEKSLDAIQEDPLYHRMVPEFGHVMDGLDARRNGVVCKFDRLYEMRLQHQIRQRRLDTEYFNIEFKCLVKDQMDREEAIAKAACLDTIRRSKPLMDENASVAPEEQANYRVLPEERPDIASGEPAEEELVEAGAASVRRTKRSSPKKRPTKELQPADEPVAKRPSLLSAAALPAEQPDDDQPLAEAGSASIVESALANETPRPEDIDVNGNNQPLIYFPHFVRRGRQAEPNNRAVVKPHIFFESDEIGFRNIYAEAEGQGPQPKNFHLDVLSFDTPSGDSQNLADHKVGDFDLELVKRYRLHPQFGILIPGCRNPDNVVPPTDFSKLLPRTNPVTFLSADGKTAFETSRSATIVHALEDWMKFEKHSDMHRTVRKYAPGHLKILNEFATFDAVAREADEARLGAEELLQAAADIEDAAQPAKRFKGSDGSTQATTDQALTMFNGAVEAESDTFIRRNHLSQGSSDSLQALADMAAFVSGDTVRSSPAPAQFVPQANVQVSTGFRSNYSPPKRTYSQAFSQMQGPGQKTKYFPAPIHASQQSMPAPPPRPLPKRREPPLPVEPTATHHMSPQQTGTQSIAPLSFVSQPAPLLRPPQQSMPPPTIAPLPMALPARAPQPTTNPTRRLQFSGNSPGAAQGAKPQHTSPYSSAPPVTTHHMMAPQNAAPNSMAPPALPNQTAGPHQMSPQLMSPRMMGPPPQIPPKMASPNMGPPKGSPQSMGPPPSLPDPSQSTFTRPRNMTGGQTVLPVPTSSQMQSPKIHSPQHLSQAQPYFQGANRQQHVQQQVPQQVQPVQQPVQPQVQAQLHQPIQQQVHQPVQQQVHQPVHQPVQQQVQQQFQQQHIQQQPFQQQPAVSSRSNRPGQSLPTLAPRPDISKSQTRQAPRHLQHQYDNATPMSPFQGTNSTPQAERPFNYAARDAYEPVARKVQHQQVQQHQAQHQQVQHQQVQHQPVQHQPVQHQQVQHQQVQHQQVQHQQVQHQQVQHQQAQQQQAQHQQVQHQQAQRQQVQQQQAQQQQAQHQQVQQQQAQHQQVQQKQVQQQHVQQHTQQQVHPHGQQPSYTQAQTQPYPQSHPHSYPLARAPKQQVPQPVQGQQYQSQLQQRQGQSPSQQFQISPVQRQAQPLSQPPTQHYQQQASQSGQSQSPGQSFQRPAQQQPQSPAPQAEQRLKRKSFGGNDGMDERDTYAQSSAPQFRPINKQYGQPQGQLQHRSPYSMPQSSVQKPGPLQGQQPGQHPSGQQQPSFNALPPPLAPPSNGRRGPGPYGA